jgi:antitoxin component of MazEF toxin-antitoxin module
MKTPLRRIGNSLGVIIPQSMRLRAMLAGEVEMSVEKGAIVLRRTESARAGWANAGKAVAARGEDALASDPWRRQP